MPQRQTVFRPCPPGADALEREALGDGVGEVPIQAQARAADGVVIGFCSPVGKNQ